MIKAQELRLGNIVYLDLPSGPGLEVHTIIGQDLADMDDGRTHGIPIKPVPLSMKILDQLGFRSEHVGHNDFHVSATWSKGSFSITEYTDRTFGMEWGTEGDVREVQHLHQLQNLYYALTGEELQVDL